MTTYVGGPHRLFTNFDEPYHGPLVHAEIAKVIRCNGVAKDLGVVAAKVGRELDLHFFESFYYDRRLRTVGLRFGVRPARMRIGCGVLDAEARHYVSVCMSLGTRLMQSLAVQLYGVLAVSLKSGRVWVTKKCGVVVLPAQLVMETSLAVAYNGVFVTLLLD